MAATEVLQHCPSSLTSTMLSPRTVDDKARRNILKPTELLQLARNRVGKKDAWRLRNGIDTVFVDMIRITRIRSRYSYSMKSDLYRTVL